MNFICSKCGAKENANTRKPICECGGLWDIENTAPKFSIEKINRNEWSQFRYIEFMNLEGDAYKEITLGEGMTSIVKVFENLYFKMDYMMPTLSYKDRGAAALIAHCKNIGVDSVVQDSSGNAGNSIAAYCAKANIKCEIFVPEGTSQEKINMIKAHGAKVNVIPGSRDNCADVCRKKVFDEGIYYANHVYNPVFYEGTKTYIYEVFEQMGRIPKNVFVPVGNGTLYLGVIKGLEDLLKAGYIEKFPNVFAVQSENCNPLVLAMENNLDKPEDIVPKQTLAEGIAIGKPMRGEEILQYGKKYDVKFINAPENRILEARSDLAKKGIYIEHTTAAIYAAYLDYIEKNGDIGETLISLTGAGLKSGH